MNAKQLILTGITVVGLFLMLLCIWGETLTGVGMATVVLLATLLIFGWVQAVVNP